MKRKKIDTEPPSAFQSIWMQAKCNGGTAMIEDRDRGREYPAWPWPTSTWLQKRLEQIRKKR